MDGPKHIIARHWRLILFAAVIGGVAWLIYALRSILFPFLLGLFLAYMLLPLVNWIQVRLPQRKGWPKIDRPLAVIIIFILFFVIAGLFLLYIFIIVYNTASSLLSNANAILASAAGTIQEWTGTLLRQIPQSMQAQANQYLAEISIEIENVSKNFISDTVSFIPATIGYIAGLITLPFFLFFILLDWKTISDGFYAAFSPTIARYLRNILSIAGDTTRHYFRGQLIMAIIIGIVDFAGMTALGVSYAPALGAIAAIGEFIPWVGPLTAGTVAALVALATVRERVIWVIAWYILVQFFENNILVPRIQGNQMHIHPAVILVVLVLGAQLAGFWGLLLALPVTAIIVKLFHYFRQEGKVEDGGEE